MSGALRKHLRRVSDALIRVLIFRVRVRAFQHLRYQMSHVIEADDDVAAPVAASNAPAVRAVSSDVEAGGIVGILQRSAHPLALTFLYLFRSAAIVVYVLCGLCTCQLPAFVATGGAADHLSYGQLRAKCM